MLLATWRRGLSLATDETAYSSQVIMLKSEAKQIGPQPQNTCGNANLGIRQIRFRHKADTFPTLAIAEVWIMGMEQRVCIACGFGVWIGPFHFDPQPYIYIYIRMYIYIYI